MYAIGINQPRRFQSTLSMRRATHARIRMVFRLCISIHALHEESDGNDKSDVQEYCISIHALHEESDWSLGAASRCTL